MKNTMAVKTTALLCLINAPLFSDLCCKEEKTMQECMNPSARCYLDDKFEVSADFLYWKAAQPNLPYAFVNTDALFQDLGYLSYIDFEWSPGVRIGLGWETDYDGWNLTASWTWLRNKSNASVGYVTEPEAPTALNFFSDIRGVHAPSILISAVNGNPTIPVYPGFASAKASWKMLYNMFDVVLGKPYSVSRKLDLTPSIGVQGGWISRRLDLFYGGAPFGTFSSQTNNLNKFWGVGPRMGLNTDWKLGSCGFALFGNFASALLFGGCFDALYDNEEAEFGEDNTHITTPSSRAQIAPMLQMAFGLGWNKCFNYSCHDYYVNLDAAWELNYYWNLPNLFQWQGNQANYSFPASLDMAGLTLRANFGF